MTDLSLNQWAVYAPVMPTLICWKSFCELKDIIDVSSSMLKTAGDLCTSVAVAANCFSTFAVWLNHLPGLWNSALKSNQNFIKDWCLLGVKEKAPNLKCCHLKPLIAPFLMPSEICVKVYKSYSVWDSLFFFFFKQTLQECKTNSNIQEIALIFNQTWLSCRTAEKPCNLCHFFLTMICVLFHFVFLVLLTACTHYRCWCWAVEVLSGWLRGRRCCHSSWFCR